MLHFPVLLEESVDFLVNKKEGSYIDCTYGRGGHTQKILDTISSNSQLTSFDKIVMLLNMQTIFKIPTLRSFKIHLVILINIFVKIQ